MKNCDFKTALVGRFAFSCVFALLFVGKSSSSDDSYYNTYRRPNRIRPAAVKLLDLNEGKCRLSFVVFAIRGDWTRHENDFENRFEFIVKSARKRLSPSFRGGLRQFVQWGQQLIWNPPLPLSYASIFYVNCWRFSHTFVMFQLFLYSINSKSWLEITYTIT